MLHEIILLILERVQFNPKKKNLKTFNSDPFLLFLVDGIKSLLNKLFCFRENTSSLFHAFACFWHPFLFIILCTCFHLTHSFADTPAFHIFFRFRLRRTLSKHTELFQARKVFYSNMLNAFVHSVGKMKFRENFGPFVFHPLPKIPHTCVKNYLGSRGTWYANLMPEFAAHVGCSKWRCNVN